MEQVANQVIFYLLSAAIIIFSVVPTLGKGNIILVPIIEVAQALIDEPFTLTSAPKS